MYRNSPCWKSSWHCTVWPGNRMTWQLWRVGLGNQWELSWGAGHLFCRKMGAPGRFWAGESLGRCKLHVAAGEWWWASGSGRRWSEGKEEYCECRKEHDQTWWLILSRPQRIGHQSWPEWPLPWSMQDNPFGKGPKLVVAPEFCFREKPCCYSSLAAARFGWRSISLGILNSLVCVWRV